MDLSPRASRNTFLNRAYTGEIGIVSTGTPQVQAICTEIEEQFYKELRRSPEHREGQRSAEWALLDFGGIVVHVFSDQARRFYDLERLWRSAPKLEIPDEPEAASRNVRIGDARASGEAVS
jgi:ribosome silencing factor RsfS/YbeB/iojap